jgi:4'-phosphopantetheinyl transferase
LTARQAPAPDEVHLWRAEFDPLQGAPDWLTRALSADERERALRYREHADRARFAWRRGWLRRLLADYLPFDSADLEFSRDARGKPCLSRPKASWLRFSLSHSAGVAVFAVTRSREVGVDVERVRADFPFDDVARRMFPPDEREALEALSKEERVDTFFRMWTRKEAYLKGIGIGLSEEPMGDPDDWRLASFDAGAGFAAAVAVEGAGVRVPGLAQMLAATA